VSSPECSQVRPRFAASWALLRSIADMRSRPDNGEERAAPPRRRRRATPALPVRCSQAGRIGWRWVGHVPVTGPGLSHHRLAARTPVALRARSARHRQVPASRESAAVPLCMAPAALPYSRTRRKRSDTTSREPAADADGEQCRGADRPDIRMGEFKWPDGDLSLG
jgi:hypothetical protein